VFIGKIYTSLSSSRYEDEQSSSQLSSIIAYSRRSNLTKQDAMILNMTNDEARAVMSRNYRGIMTPSSQQRLVICQLQSSELFKNALTILNTLGGVVQYEEVNIPGEVRHRRSYVTLFH